MAPRGINQFGWGVAKGSLIKRSCSPTPEQVDELAAIFGPPDTCALRQGPEHHGLLRREQLYSCIPGR